MASSFAPAKVNLYLHVTGRRADGYHLLDSLAVFAGIGDRLSRTAEAAVSLRITGPFAARLTEGDNTRGDNLVLRAARRVAAAAPGALPAGRLVLEKNLPIASGIGGGSADAAACLRLLQRDDELPLREIARELGADVPVCLERRPARMSGTGEILGAAPGLPEFGLVLVNPGCAVATAAVFAARAGGFSTPARLPDSWPHARALADSLAGLRNDLQDAAIGLAPEIARVLQHLQARPGVLLARMSGSGATCFGLLETPAEAEAAAISLQRPGWWCWGGGLYEPGSGDL